MSALNYPFNLGEGRFFQQTDNDIHYYLGVCYAQEKQHKISLHHFKKTTQGAQEIGQSRYYNDQPADYLFYQAIALHRLGNTDKS